MTRHSPRLSRNNYPDTPFPAGNTKNLEEETPPFANATLDYSQTAIKIRKDSPLIPKMYSTKKEAKEKISKSVHETIPDNIPEKEPQIHIPSASEFAEMSPFRQGLQRAWLSPAVKPVAQKKSRSGLISKTRLFRDITKQLLDEAKEQNEEPLESTEVVNNENVMEEKLANEQNIVKEALTEEEFYAELKENNEKEDGQVEEDKVVEHVEHALMEEENFTTQQPSRWMTLFLGVIAFTYSFLILIGNVFIFTLGFLLRNKRYWGVGIMICSFLYFYYRVSFSSSLSENVSNNAVFGSFEYDMEKKNGEIDNYEQENVHEDTSPKIVFENPVNENLAESVNDKSMLGKTESAYTTPIHTQSFDDKLHNQFRDIQQHQQVQSKVMDDTTQHIESLTVMINSLRNQLSEIQKAEEKEKNSKKNELSYLNTREVFERVVDERVYFVLEKERLENIPLADYANIAGGAIIIETMTSMTYNPLTQLNTKKKNENGWFWGLFNGVPKKGVAVYGPEIALSGNTDLRMTECWPLHGSSGKLTIRLSRRIQIHNFTIGHLSQKSVLGGETLSAPKDFAVYGMKNLDDVPKLLIEDTYDVNNIARPNQMFTVNNNQIDFQYVQLEIRSNYGQSLYTCLYRFSVHGVVV